MGIRVGGGSRRYAENWDRIFGKGVETRQAEDAVRSTTAEASRATPNLSRKQRDWRKWPRVWRPFKGGYERTCPHGVGHPEPECADQVHGCDGCCWLMDESNRVT